MEMEPGKLFIGGISWDTSEERLREYFQTFGEVVEVVIMKDRITGRARGFGFVVFANASVAEKVVRERHIIDGRTVEAKKAVPRDDHQNFNRNNGSIQVSSSPSPTKKIFVGGLASSVTENEFKRYFDQFGTITDVVVMYDHNTQRPRGFGFITYDSEESVEIVLLKTFHELNGKMVEVKRAVPKELSPGPTRNQTCGHSYDLNRVNSLLNAYSQGYNSSLPGGYGMRMEGRFSPVAVGRSGCPPYSPSNYSMGLNSDFGFDLNYGASEDSGSSYGRGMSSYYNGNMNRFGGPIGYDIGGAGNGPMLNKTSRNLWGNGSLNYSSNSIMPNTFVGSGSGNTGLAGGSGNIGEIWGSSPASAQGGGSASLGSRNFGYGIGENNFGGRTGYVRDIGGTGNTTSSFSVTNNINDRGLGNLYESKSLYGDHTWRSSSPELEGTSPFGYELGAAADAAPNNTIGYVGDYSVDARSNKGIAA